MGQCKSTLHATAVAEPATQLVGGAKALPAVLTFHVEVDASAGAQPVGSAKASLDPAALSWQQQQQAGGAVSAQGGDVIAAEPSPRDATAAAMITAGGASVRVRHLVLPEAAAPAGGPAAAASQLSKGAAGSKHSGGGGKAATSRSVPGSSTTTGAAVAAAAAPPAPTTLPRCSPPLAPPQQHHHTPRSARQQQAQQQFSGVPMLAPVAVTTIDTPRPLPTLPPLTLPRRPVSPTKARQLAAVPMAALIHSVGSLSRAGREHSANRKQNQDSCFAYQQYLQPTQALLATLDGHGPNGHEVSAYLKKQLPLVLADLLGGPAGRGGGGGEEAGSAVAARPLDPAAALATCFRRVDASLQAAASGINCHYSGSTAVVTLLQGRRLTTAWVGDSRAVLVRQEPRGCKAICLTRDHKPSSVEERQRIVNSGGRVERLVDQRGMPVGPHRVWLSTSWVPGLAMSRAMGDMVAQSVGVTSEAETTSVELCSQDKFLILATDGVWEFITPQAAMDCILSCKDAEEACRTLVDAAWNRWVQEEEGVVDDISVVVIKFNPL